MDISAFERKLESLIDLDADDRRAVAALPVTEHRVGRRRDILRQGDRPTFVYILLEGWAARYSLRSDGSRRITGFLLPGDFCGIHAVCHAAMDHAIVAITDCRVGQVDREAMRTLTDSRDAIAEAVWRAKLAEEAILRKWLLASDDAYHALAHLLCELFERADQLGLVRGDVLSVPLTQEEIGDALGLTAVHVNRTLQRLRAEGLIVLENKQLTIADSGALRRAAEFKHEYLRSWRDRSDR